MSRHLARGTRLAAAMSLLGLAACSTSDPLYGNRPQSPRAPPAPRREPSEPRPQVMAPIEETEPAQETPAEKQEAPPKEPDPVAPPSPPDPPDPIAEQRDLDLDAYESDYLRQKERLFAEHAGEWVVVVAGRLLPTDARGRVEPARSLSECVRAADVAAPDAKHRYVFRIGEEGDVVYADTAGEPRNVIGAALKGSLGVYAAFDPSIGELRWSKGDKVRAFKLEQERIVLSLSDPSNAQSNDVRLADSSGFSGFVALESAAGDLLDAEKFEIPGRVLLRTTSGIHELRRARVRLHVRELALDEIVPAAVWAQ
jgi:hypothetical protein